MKEQNIKLLNEILDKKFEIKEESGYDPLDVDNFLDYINESIKAVMDENDALKEENKQLSTTNNLLREDNKKLMSANEELKADVEFYVKNGYGSFKE
jgi:cell division septum initiation protein DivIVA